MKDTTQIGYENAGVNIEVCCTLIAMHIPKLMGCQLKFLYVAITRARNNLLFMDRSLTSGPMKVNCNVTVSLCLCS